MADYQPGDCLKEGTQILNLFIGPAKGVKNCEAPHINKDSLPLSLFMSFFTEIFRLLAEQTIIYYQQRLDGQARPGCRLPDFTLPDMMTFNHFLLADECT